MGQLRWTGRVIRMNPTNPIKLPFLYNQDGNRKVGRPKLKWQKGVERDAEKAKICNQKTAATDRPMARSPSTGQDTPAWQHS